MDLDCKNEYLIEAERMIKSAEYGEGFETREQAVLGAIAWALIGIGKELRDLNQRHLDDIEALQQEIVQLQSELP